MDERGWSQEENYWPIRTLKFLARFPHEYDTWLWMTHTVPHGDPAEPFAPNTEMSGVILFSPLTTVESFRQLEIDSEKTIHFHSVIPLHEAEMDLKLQEGLEALFGALNEQDVSEVLDPQRPSAWVSE